MTGDNVFDFDWFRKWYDIFAPMKTRQARIKTLTQCQSCVRIISFINCGKCYFAVWTAKIDLIGQLNVVPNLNLPGLRFFVYCICMEIPGTKRFSPKVFELDTMDRSRSIV